MVNGGVKFDKSMKYLNISKFVNERMKYKGLYWTVCINRIYWQNIQTASYIIDTVCSE
jgi:hypothetical protein